MQGEGGKDEVTETLSRDLDTVVDETTAETVTEVQPGDSDVTVTVAMTRPSRGEKRRWLWWLVAGGLAVAIAALLGGYFSNRQPPALDNAVPRVDIYGEALELAGSAIARDNINSLPRLLLSLLDGQPDNVEVQGLLEDAINLRNMLYLQEKGRVLELAEARGSQTFHSSLFEEAARQQIVQSLPPPAIIQRLSAARDAWRSGDLVAAITAVKEVATETENQQAQAMLHHYSQVVEDYEALSSQDSGSDYAQSLLSFYLGLDPQQDLFFWQRLEKDFKMTGDTLPLEASQQLQRAGLLWSNYKNQGGIDWGMLPVAGADTEIRKRLGELAEANKLVKAVTGLLEPTGHAVSKTHLFPSLVNEELSLQRSRFEELRNFNDDAVLEDRLFMLPTTEAKDAP